MNKTKTTCFKTTALAAAALLAGCAATGPSDLDSRKVTEVDTRSQALIAQRVAQESARLAELQNELLKQAEKTRAAAVQPATPVVNPLDAVNVTLKVDDADVRFVFRAIADQARLNLVLPTILSTQPRTITLSLSNMPASQVFAHVLSTLDMHGRVERGVMIVAPYEERVFNLDFLQTSVNADFNAGGDVFGANQTAGGSAHTGTGVQGGSGDAAASGIRNGFNIRGRNTNDMDPFAQVEAMLRTVIQPEGDGPQRPEAGRAATQQPAQRAFDPTGPRFALNRSTGTLYVKGRPSQMATIAQQIDHAKTVLGRQVLIEAQILDIELNDEFQYGVDWTRLRNSAAVNFGLNPMLLGGVATTVPNAANPGRTVTIPAQAVGGTGVPSLGAVSGGPSHSVAINLLKTFGAVHVLSNPSLRVRNTQPAVVSVGRNERYVAQTTSNVSQSGGGQSTVSANVITGNLFDGVMLGVIPFVGSDGVISLTINPVQTTIQPGSSELINVGTEQNPQRISLPKVDFKGITTSLNLRNGDMVILGGLIGETGSRSKAGLPGVAEVPVLGELLGNVNRRTNARELVVILRVRTL